MGPTAEELKRDIEHKREELGDDLTALGDHVSPQQIVQRKKVEYRFRAQQLWAQAREKLHATSAPASDELGEPDGAGAPAPIENPAVVGAAGLVVGLLVGAVWSRRRTRRRLARRAART
jgi:hypothetical protein